MQPTPVQVDQALAALRAGSGDRGDALATERCDEILRRVLARLSAQPRVRADRLAEARRRLAEGTRPSDGDLADRIVGRLVCDRLR